MKCFKLNPNAQRRLQRFKSFKRGYYSFIVLLVLTLLCPVASLLVGNTPLMVKYDGQLYFPAFKHGVYSGEDFGEDYAYEAEYRDLKEKWADTDNRVWMPIVPYSPTEHDSIDRASIIIELGELEKLQALELEKLKTSGLTATELTATIAQFEERTFNETATLKQTMFHPRPPTAATKHYLGTDPSGRDVLAVLIYGYRIAISFSLMLLLATYVIGVTVGCLMGYYGGWFDLLVQRLIEVLSRMPFLFVMMIIAVIWKRSFGVLLLVMILFRWMSITWQMRTATYREKARDYVMAARSLGAGTPRIIFVHIIPSTIAILVTFIPFSISGAIIALTSLDYLGFGLPPGTPSWGELMKIGTDNMDSPWIVSSVVAALVILLFLVNLTGEAVREAYDPKKHTVYE